LDVIIFEKGERMRKEKADRDPNLQVPGHGHRSRSQVRGFSEEGYLRYTQIGSGETVAGILVTLPRSSWDTAA